MELATIDWPALLTRLAEPFPADQLKWRAGAVNRDKTKAIALAYAEPRTYEDRLNTVCPGNWHVDFQPWGEHRIICRLTIHNLTRSSTGESGDANPTIAGTSAEAQAFKRACSKYGLGRYLYDLPTTWVDYDPNSKKLLGTPSLTAAINTPEVRTPDPDGVEPSNALGKERASAMHRELVRIGVPRSLHYAFASESTGKFISSFATLTEEDAALIWNAARNRAATSNGRATTLQPVTTSGSPVTRALEKSVGPEASL